MIEILKWLLLGPIVGLSLPLIIMSLVAGLLYETAVIAFASGRYIISKNFVTREPRR